MIRYFTDNSNNQLEYTYAVGRIRELERGLLSKALLNKITEAADLASALNILIESDLGCYRFDIHNPIDFEASLNQELSYTYKVIRDISPYPFLYYIFSLRYSFHNIKILIKSKYLEEKNFSKILSEISTINIRNLEAVIKEEKYEEISVSFGSAIKKAISEYDKLKDPEIIDLTLDIERYNIISNILNDIEVPFLKKFIKINIDLNNIITSIRIKLRGEDKNYLRKVLIDGGDLDTKNILEIYNSPLSSWNTKFLKTDYEKVVKMGLKDYQENNSLMEIERLRDDFILSFVKVGKIITFGIEPLVGFLVAKENDIKNIRIILSGKLNKLSPDQIKERVRDTYV